MPQDPREKVRLDAVEACRKMLVDAGFDCGIILVTASIDGDNGEMLTTCNRAGFGNWFAQSGLLKHYQNRFEENSKIEERMYSKPLGDQDGE